MLFSPITEIFCDIDDFYKLYIKHAVSKALPSLKGKRQRKTTLTYSEIITIAILFHLSHYRTFKDFYQDCVVNQLSTYFPHTVSYP